MSERNYHRLRRKGITGSNTPTCYVAACDRITPPARISAAMYRQYTAYVNAEKKMTTKREKNAKFVGVLDALAVNLGLDNNRDFEFENVHTARELGLLVKKCFRRDIGVVLDINAFDARYDNEGDDCNHAVGLLPVSTEPVHFSLRSTYIPGGLGGILTPCDIFAWLMHQDPKTEPFMKQYTFNDANVTTFPVYHPPEIQSPKARSYTRGTGTK